MKFGTVIYLLSVSALFCSCGIYSSARVSYVDDLYNVDGTMTPVEKKREVKSEPKKVYVTQKLDFDNYYPGMIEEALTGTKSAEYYPDTLSSDSVGSYKEGFVDGFKDGYSLGYRDSFGWLPSWYSFGAYSPYYRPGWGFSFSWSSPSWYSWGLWYDPWYYPWYDPWYYPWYDPWYSWYSPWYSPWYSSWYYPWYSPWYPYYPHYGTGHSHRDVIYGSGRRNSPLSAGGSSGYASGNFRRPSISSSTVKGYGGYGGYYGSSSSYGTSGRRPSGTTISGGTSGIAGGRGSSVYSGGSYDSSYSGNRNNSYNNNSYNSNRNNSSYSGNSVGVRTPVTRDSQSYNSGSSRSYGSYSGGSGSYGRSGGSSGSYGGGRSVGGRR